MRRESVSLSTSKTAIQPDKLGVRWAKSGRGAVPGMPERWRCQCPTVGQSGNGSLLHVVQLFGVRPARVDAVLQVWSCRCSFAAPGPVTGHLPRDKAGGR
jgi:hypothetical protein